MGKIVKHDQPCIKCKSSDAMQIYEDGTAMCYSCDTWSSKEEVDAGHAIIREKREQDKVKTKLPSMEEIADFPVKALTPRKIPFEICKFFDVRVSFDSAGEIDTHYYPHGDGYNIRQTKEKKFFRQGTFTKLFGQDKFAPGGKRLIITEGECDAMAIATAMANTGKKRIYPVATMGSAVNIKMLLEQRDWIRSFDEVVLWFDNDEKGQKAFKEAQRIIGYDKVKKAGNVSQKDANDVLTKEGIEHVLIPVYDAYRVTPEGIVGKAALWERLVEYNQLESLPFPDCMAGVNTKLKGKRLGEITLFISGTGSGKSTLLREDMLNTLANTPDDVKIGVLSLEEDPAETARKLAGMYLNRNPADEEIPIEELKVGFDAVFGTDRVVLLDHQGSINDNSIIDQLEYMALIGCKYIYIDHITILVSEGIEKLTGNEAQDKMMNELLKLVKRHSVWIGLVSHLRKTQSGGKSFEEGRLPSMDDIRGSGSIKQISFDIIAFARNLVAKEELVRNTIKMSVLKARYTGLTGRVIGAVYDQKTGRLTAADDDSLSDDDEQFDSDIKTTWVNK